MLAGPYSRVTEEKKITFAGQSWPTSVIEPEPNVEAHETGCISPIRSPHKTLKSSSDSESDSHCVEEKEGLRKDEVLGSGSDTDDEEWRQSRVVIEQVNNTQDESNKIVVAKFINESIDENRKEVEVEAGGYSSYEDSDADVNSPGESDDDDIRGNKYKVKVPIVTDTTNWSKWQWVPGTRFATRDAFREAVRRYAVTNGRNLKISVSNKNRNGRLGAYCVQGCPFKVYLSFVEKKACYMVKSVTMEHTCQRNMNKNIQLTSSFIADELLPVFKQRPQWPAKEIQDAVREKYKVFIAKWMAYKAKKCAHNKLHGSMKDHYSKIGSYIEALRQENPTSTFVLEIVTPAYLRVEGSEMVFHRLFVCFDGVKQGFLAGCRKVLCLDGCFLKTFLGGMLLAAIGRDPNDQMYPVAWAVVEGENNDSWQWFMNELRKCLDVQDEGKGWTLISDQQKGLLNGVTMYWSKAEHRNCARHIYANWHKKHKGDDLKGAFWKAVRAYSEADHKAALEEMNGLSEEAKTSFIEQNPKCFCRCYLDGDRKADVVVNNMAETFNGFIIQSRSKHIINMLEDIRVAIMTRLVTKHNEMIKKTVLVCPRIQKKLNFSKDRASDCRVSPSSPNLYQVSDKEEVAVNLDKRTCSCRKWDLTGIPCHHACAVLGFLGMPAENYVDKCYSKELYLLAYDRCIPPLPSEKYWPHVDFPLDPPPIKIGPGRPKKNRRKDPHEDPKRKGKLTKHGGTTTCSNCKAKGHNKRKCPEKGKVIAETSKPPKRPRGRPKKTQESKQSQEAKKSIAV
ncbi:hypothetical protein SSX86_011696 [Deinandra increscens subsp. villosa]|uniref:SWIM-type domain-containing protein n=1 Tax=Deinandra increscens subsp. villosa TaxID=3103831 RepID=A0AAP0D2T1_9ASTR